MPVKRGLYRVPWLARLIRRGLNRALPEGLTPVRVAAGGLVGMQLLLDLQREKDYWLGTYEPELQLAIADWVRPGMVVYDVGANVGYVTLLLARAASPGGRVFAFEALPENLERLSANLDLNPLAARVTVVPGAVVDRPGAARFLIGPSGGMGKAEGSAGREVAIYERAITVPGYALDDFVYAAGNPAPQVIKMDIEGGEVLALPGMKRLLAEARPTLLVELHGPQAARAAWQALQPAGYALCRMARGYQPLPSPEALGWKAHVVARPER